MMATAKQPKACDRCNGPITDGPWFKRFCGDDCRITYHKERRDRAFELLDEEEESAGGGDDAR